MANPLKQLAGETAIYGLSTILARIINFLFVPIYTRILSTSSYGVVTEFLAYIAVLQVILVLGLETGCFRFANKEGTDPRSVYSNAFATVFGLNALFLATLILFIRPIASGLGYAGYENVILYVGGILMLDSLTAILFARLRQEHKALKFAIIKTAKILTETVANLYLFLVFPKHPVAFLERFVSATPDFSYPIFAIFVSSVVCAVLLLPDFFRLTMRLDGKLLRKMLGYSIPLMISTLPGIVNDFLDRVLFRFFDTGSEAWRSSLGIYQAAIKIATIMNLFIQMFRYAAEPFFFQRAKDKGSKQLYAIVMEYFTAFCGLIFLGVILYIDVLSLILGRDFRVGIGIVPIMLMSYILLGMLFNVSMWYKLSDKTKIAIWITLAGLVVTTVINVLFMPRFSYWAAAWGHLASYVTMFVISAALGAKYYPIPYNWKRILGLLVLMLAIYGLSAALDTLFFQDALIGQSSAGPILLKLLVHTALIAVYLGICWRLLRGRYQLAIHSADPE